MDAAQALADLTEISSQIEAAVLFDEAGDIVASTLADDGAARALARASAELLAGAGAFRSDAAAVTQLEVSTRDGSVFVVREGDRLIAAVTSPDPTVGLVFYDLKSTLRTTVQEPQPTAAEEPAPAPEPPPEPPKRRTRKPKKEPGDAEA